MPDRKLSGILPLQRRFCRCRIFFYLIGQFLSYQIKKDAPLWMRTRTKGNHCLTASRSARVCAKAHTFYPIGQFLSFSPDKQKIPQRLRYFQSPWGMFVSYIFKIRCLISSFVYRTEQFHFFFNSSFDSFETRS